jgi:hypothetical protein
MRATVIAIVLVALAATTASAAVNDNAIEGWFDREGLYYDKVRPGYWTLDFQGDNYSPITLMITLRENDDGEPTYVTFWALMQFIPDKVLRSDKKMYELNMHLLQIGYEQYLVKMVIDSDNQIGVQVELPSEGLTYEAFVKGLWRTVNVADDDYPMIEQYLD